MTYVIITGPNCKWCEKAKDALDDAQVPWVLFSTDTQYSGPTIRSFLLSNNLMSVPQVWCDGRYIGGCNELLAHLHEELQKHKEPSLGSPSILKD